MKKIIVCALLLAAGCDSAPSANDSGSGTAALSLELEELSPGENYISGDGVLLNFSTFALAFQGISLGGENVTADFTADFFDEEAVDVVEIEDVPTGEYEEVRLTLGTAAGLSGAAVLAVKRAATGDGVTSSLNGLSALIVGQGINGSATCDVRVELISSGVLNVPGEEASHVAVEAGEEAEILVVAYPNKVFEGVSLSPLCVDGADVVISETLHPSHAAAILDNLISNDTFALGSTEGHTHSH